MKPIKFPGGNRPVGPVLNSKNHYVYNDQHVPALCRAESDPSIKTAKDSGTIQR